MPGKVKIANHFETKEMEDARRVNIQTEGLQIDITLMQEYNYHRSISIFIKGLNKNHWAILPRDDGFELIVLPERIEV